MQCDLTGKIALVTGAGGGLGQAIATQFADAGAKVVAVDIVAEALEKFVAARSDGAIVAEKMDVTSSESVNAAIAKAVDRFGTIDVLVNSAGVTFRHEPLQFPEDAFDRIMAINVKGTFLCSQAVARVMAAGEGGKIINIISIGGMRALPNTVAYCTSKGAVANMTRALALDLAKHKINVNGIAPSTVKTPLADQVFADPEALKWFVERIPLGRLCETSDVAQAAQFLASPPSDFINGHILYVDGGWSA